VGVCRSKGMNRENDDKDNERECDYPSHVALELDIDWVRHDSWSKIFETLDGVYFLRSSGETIERRPGLCCHNLVIIQYYMSTVWEKLRQH